MKSEERRSGPRVATEEGVAIETGGFTGLATIRNLSQAGCMIECAGFEASIGDHCELALYPGFPASGRIVWQLGEAIGISFFQPVPIGIVLEYALDDWRLRRA